MSLAMWHGASEAIAGFADDDTVRCIVFTGAGTKAFVAGADISKFENERASVEHIETYNRAVATYHRTVQGLMKPTIARIDGRSEEHTSELQSIMRNTYAIFCLKKKITVH